MAEASLAPPPPHEPAPPFVAPWPGSKEMPHWNSGELVDAPRFTWKNWFAMLGPGLLVGGSAIGGGEWLAGPAVTARYGGALMWLATLSIVGQVFYNVEISRYALYTGEPIFTGKFRTLPGPRFWLFMYLLLDFGAVFPYLAANAATPLAAVYLGHIPSGVGDESLVRGLGFAVFLGAMLPLIFGGKIYNTLKVVMSFKIVVVLGFLMFLAVFFSSRQTWVEIVSGFFKFGTVPVQRGEDTNGNGVLDPGEDWDGDGHLDVVEERLQPTIDTDGDGQPDAWADVDGDGKPDKFRDVDGDGVCDGDNTENVFVALAEGRPFPKIDFSTIALLAAFAAIAGCGGLSNAPISNYTRDQGWGMGHHVGAIPSVIGGHNIELSHVGMVFQVTRDSLHALAALGPPRAARPDGGLDAGLLSRHGAAQHALGAVLAARNRSQRMVRRRHDRRRRQRRRRVGLGLGRRIDHLVHDPVVWVLGVGAGHGHQRRRRHPPLGRRGVDFQPAIARVGSQAHQNALLLRAAGLHGDRPVPAVDRQTAGAVDHRHQHHEFRVGDQLLPHAGHQLDPAAQDLAAGLVRADWAERRWRVLSVAGHDFRHRDAAAVFLSGQL